MEPVCWDGTGEWGPRSMKPQYVKFSSYEYGSRLRFAAPSSADPAPGSTTLTSSTLGHDSREAKHHMLHITSNANSMKKASAADSVSGAHA